MDLADAYEAERPRLVSLAYRMVGSRQDAEDAVQTAWLRAESASDDPERPEAWFTTVTARVCLDLLRARRRRGELPLLAEHVDPAAIAVDEDYLRREQVSRAMLVVLDALTPQQRVAYVLHDLFAVPFDEVAVVLDTTADAAKKQASRARRRLAGVEAGATPTAAADLAVVDAFLAAARGGDLARMVAMLAPDAVRTADLAFLRGGTAPEVRGAEAVAEETAAFRDRIAVAASVFIDGVPGAVVAPGGHPAGMVRFTLRDGLVARIDIVAYAADSVSLGGATASRSA